MLPPQSQHTVNHFLDYTETVLHQDYYSLWSGVTLGHSLPLLKSLVPQNKFSWEVLK